MLDHVQDEYQVKEGILVFHEVCKVKLQPLVGSTFCQFNSLWRDIISPEHTFAIQVLLKLPQHFSSATSHVTDCLRGKMILPKHAKNLSCLPGRLFNMPLRILRNVFAIEVKGSACHGAPHWRSKNLLLGGRQRSPLRDSRKPPGLAPCQGPRSPIYFLGDSVSSGFPHATCH